ncbi:uncharacterized protein LOC129614975 [Condylostylus longicornis]|uniref:uncharacterized protein LOC129614975 n=1 Tax=Condylostylus longicornis TaxID=2530218 RepID=UPI00244D9CE5|nr:uncharacterized protein LOC129614975 [Condylostylus longicornis]
MESYKLSNIKRKHNQHWIDKELIEAVKIKNGSFSKWSRDSSNTFLENQYKYYRNKVTSMRRYKKQKYFEKKFAEHSTDSSKIWQCIKNMLYNRVSNKSGVDLLKGLSEQNAEIEINNLNKHFAGIGESMTKNFESKIFYPQSYTDLSFEFEFSDKNEINKIIKQLKSSKTTDSLNLSNNLIKICNEYLCDSIALIINESLAEGVFPEALKLGRIVPIFKSGDKSDYNNYRPICIAPGPSKIIEKVVYTQVSRFLENNKILSKMQYGYRIKSNTETSVGFANKWFSSYLQNRKQFTHIGANKSENQLVTYGVPQGSILGPLLFIVYMDSINKIGIEADIYLYADDICLVFQADSYKDLQNRMNRELDKVIYLEWMKTQKLTVNRNKTKYLIVAATAPKLNIKIANENEAQGQHLTQKLLMFTQYFSLTLQDFKEMHPTIKNVMMDTHHGKANSLILYSTQIIEHLNRIKENIPSDIKLSIISKLYRLNINNTKVGAESKWLHLLDRAYLYNIVWHDENYEVKLFNNGILTFNGD